MSDPTSLTVPDAGWYADRNDANTVRWWDGSQWTDHTHSIAPEQNVAQPVSASAFGFTPVEPNPLAAARTADVVPAVGQVAPGWYPDNADPSMQRWWDGTQWTSHTAPKVAIPSPSAAAYLGADATPLAPYGTASPGGMRSASNTTATLAMIFSLVSFAGLIFAPLLLLAIAGIVTGIVALRRAKLYAPPGGRRGQAIAGVAVGAVSLVATILLTVAAIGVYQQVHQTTGSQAGTHQSTNGTPVDSAWWNEDHAGTGVPYTLSVIKQNTSTDFLSHYGVAASQIDCDSDAAVLPGDFFECTVTMADHRTAGIQIAMSDGTDGGYNIMILDLPSGGDGAPNPSTPPSDDTSDPDLSNT